MTTSVRDALGGRLHASLDAAPLGLVLLAVATAMVLGIVPARVRLITWLMVLGLACEWMFELHRFQVL